MYLHDQLPIRLRWPPCTMAGMPFTLLGKVGACHA
jgi:hypothetical protein